MIAHQTKGVDAVTESLDPFLNQKVEACTILIIEENGSAAIAAQDDVIECSRIVDPWLSCHATMLHHKLQYSKPDPIFTDRAKIDRLWIKKRNHVSLS
jgi:hypothetical protein